MITARRSGTAEFCAAAAATLLIAAGLVPTGQRPASSLQHAQVARHNEAPSLHGLKQTRSRAPTYRVADLGPLDHPAGMAGRIRRPIRLPSNWPVSLQRAALS